MHSEVLAVPILAVMIPLVVAPTAIIMRHRHRKREFEHTERMRALEVGAPIPQSHAWPALVAIAMGAGVPVGAFLFAFLATTVSGADDAVFGVAGVVGVAGVIAGYRLGSRLVEATHTAPPMTLAARSPNGKPMFDPDAYDVAGRRG